MPLVANVTPHTLIRLLFAAEKVREGRGVNIEGFWSLFYLLSVPAAAFPAL